MTHVLYVLGNFPTLSETFIINELNEIERNNLQISIVSTARKSEIPPVMHAFAQALQQRTHYMPASSADMGRIIASQVIRHPGRSFEIWRRNNEIPVLNGHNKFKRWLKCLVVADFAEKFKATHLHGHWTTPSDVAAIVAKTLGLTYSFTLHAHDIYDEDTVLQKKGGGAALRSDGATFVATCTRYNYQHLLERYGSQFKAPLYPIYHGVNTDLFKPGETRNDKLTILSVGRIIAYKGFDRLVEVMHKLRGDGYDFVCYCIGDGSLREPLVERVKELGLEDYVIFTGPLPAEEVQKYYAKAHIFALAGSVQKGQHGLPNVLVEAMSSGLSVVTTALPPAVELIDSGFDGLVVEDSDQAIYEGLKQVISNPELRQSFAGRAREKAIAHFSLQANTRRIANLLCGQIEPSALASESAESAKGVLDG